MTAVALAQWLVLYSSLKMLQKSVTTVFTWRKQSLKIVPIENDKLYLGTPQLPVEVVENTVVGVPDVVAVEDDGCFKPVIIVGGVRVVKLLNVHQKLSRIKLVSFYKT